MNKFNAKKSELLKFGKQSKTYNINNVKVTKDELQEITTNNKTVNDTLPEIELENIYQKDEIVVEKTQLNEIPISKEENTKKFVQTVNQIIKDKKAKNGW